MQEESENHGSLKLPNVHLNKEVRRKKVTKNSGDKKFRKELKRRRKRRSSPNLVPSNYQLRQLSIKSYSSFIRFINKNIEEDTTPSHAILVPKSLSFVTKFDSTIKFFSEIHNSLYKTNEDVVIDFKKCNHVSLGTATYLQIMLMEFFDFKHKYNSANYSQLDKNIDIKKSRTTATNRMLYALNITDSMGANDDIESSSYLSMGLVRNLKYRSSYKENKKGNTCAKVIHFVNESIKGSRYELNENGKNNMDNLISEILGNAEDHSLLNEYYVNGVSFKENDSDDIVELNLVILNLGDSIYEGFQKTKIKNSRINKLMEQLFGVHEPKFNGSYRNNYSKESLFTLYALQEGVSRLKFKEPSRGNGTMNFIRAFMTLGAFGEGNSKYESRLNVISGHTVIECPNKYKPFQKGNFYRLSLNDKKDIKELPDRKCIFVNKEYFPGTILQVKIFMCKEYFMKTVKEDD